jgi:hypothetical protein
MVESAAVRELNRRSIQEFRIDFLLEEEFACDPEFTLKFIKKCGLDCDSAVVTSVKLEPKLQNGYGDLLVILDTRLTSGAQVRLALLIEDKISAGAPPRQAERYREFGEHGFGEKWDEYRTVLIAPDAYTGEKVKYDVFIPLETVHEWICSNEPNRAIFRRGKIVEAIKKKSLSGLQNYDPTITSFRAAYYDFVMSYNVDRGTDFECDPPRPAYDGDTWLLIESKTLPKKSRFRHKLSTTIKDSRGIVELAFHNTDIAKATNLRSLIDSDMRLVPNGKHFQHVAIELEVPEIRNPISFDAEKDKVKRALYEIERLWRFFQLHKAEIEKTLSVARSHWK